VAHKSASMIVRWGLVGMVALGVADCAGRDREPPAPAPDSAQAAASRPAAADDRPTIVFAGTSLTAGYGLPDPSLAYPALIQHLVDSLGLDYRVVNAGVSGETSAGLLRRIDWILGQGRVAALVIETGANDGLRGQDPDSVRANIQAVIDSTRRLDPPPRVVLAGMEALPNLGADYSRRFRAIFPELARENHLALVPFLLAGVAGVDSLNQADGIHPTPAGQRIVAWNVWRVLEPVLTPTS
jgi:acyl-CoA thioesterase I